MHDVYSMAKGGDHAAKRCLHLPFIVSSCTCQHTLQEKSYQTYDELRGSQREVTLQGRTHRLTW